MRRLAPMLALTLLFSMLAFVAAAVEDTTVVVHPDDMQGWTFVTENTPGASGALVPGPGAPPAGSGSANLIVTASDQGYNLGAAILGGTRLDTITALSYSTYRTSGESDLLAASLQFNVDYDVTDGDGPWQGRLVYEPYRMGTVTTGVWQTWDAFDGLWWATGSPGNTQCGQSTPCTLTQVLTNWPNAGINAADPRVLFRVGTAWGHFDGNVDALVIGVDDVNTTYDFEFAVQHALNACLFAGSLSQVGAENPFCGRGALVELIEGDDLFACLYVGRLTQVGFSEPNCGRGESIGLASGDGLYGCLYSGSLSRVGASPSPCGRGTPVSFDGGFIGS